MNLQPSRPSPDLQEESSLVARRIYEIILQLRNDAPDSEGAQASDDAEGGDAHHIGKIERFVAAGQPIRLVLPAFPAKSSNPEKTLGVLPDYGEVLALQRLDRLCAEIERVYSPGARIIICSDGRVFSDLVQVPDEAVTRYGQGIQAIISEFGLTRLYTYNLDDVFPAAGGYDALRRELVERYAEPLESLKARVAADPETRSLFNGIHRFLFEDIIALHPEMSRTKVRNWSKELAYGTIQRSNAWSRLVESFFPDAVRLSIHPQPARSRKLGVRLVPSANMWRTPWHSTVLFDGAEYRLVRRQEAEEMGAVLMSAEGRYPYFAAPAVSAAQGQSDAQRAFN